MEEYVYKDGKKLRKGFTTGSCAAAAAKGATTMILSGKDLPTVSMEVKDTLLEFPLLDRNRGERWCSCAVKKDSGDDPDVTNGILVFAKVTLEPDQKGTITIDGGMGVGRVTKPGLACQVGEAAINPVPRKNIEEQVKQICQEFGYDGGLKVIISIPEGIEIAKKTYNPRLGIEGGISVLGTTGIVEPMSEQALVDTIKVEMNLRKAAGAKYIVLTPGNYGETFLTNTMGLEPKYTVKCSNFIGEAIDYAVQCGFLGVLLIGHIGKFVKLAAGMFNTHSKYGDARMEILGTHSILVGAKPQTLKKLMNCVTTDDAIAVLDEENMREKTLQSILEKIEFHIHERSHGQMEMGALMFSNQYGYLGETNNVKNLLKKLEE